MPVPSFTAMTASFPFSPFFSLSPFSIRVPGTTDTCHPPHADFPTANISPQHERLTSSSRTLQATDVPFRTVLSLLFVSADRTKNHQPLTKPALTARRRPQPNRRHLREDCSPPRRQLYIDHRAWRTFFFIALITPILAELSCWTAFSPGRYLASLISTPLATRQQYVHVPSSRHGRCAPGELCPTQ